MPPFLLFAIATAARADSWTVSSPDLELSLEIKQSDNGGLDYRVNLKRKTVVGWSKLGLIRSSWDRERYHIKGCV